MNKKKTTIWNERGFGLIEVIVGIAMLLLTSTAALSLAETVIKVEGINENKVIAYNLAQQVIEETRRVRDSSWDDFKSATRWEEETVDSSDIFLGEGSSENINCELEGLELVCQIGEEGREYRISREINDVANISTLNGGDINSKRGTGIDSGLAKQVKVIVTWNDRGKDYNLTLMTLLTDWRSYYN